MIANRHSQAALLKSQIDQIDHRLKELEKSASSLRVAMARLREQMEAALPPPPPTPPPPPPLLVPREGYMVRWNKLPKDTSPEAERKREYMRNYMRGRRQSLLEAAEAVHEPGSGPKRTCRGHPAMSDMADL
jgi:hypothetical protein